MGVMKTIMGQRYFNNNHSMPYFYGFLLATLFIITKSSTALSNNNAFNPKISVILDGQYSHYRNNVEDYELPGFFLGGEAGLADEGFSIGHTELLLSANVDHLFYGQLAIGLAEHDGHTDVHVEEAYINTLSLNYGLALRAGRFYSAVGYLNQQHEHAWDFGDAPLVYRGIWGRQYVDDGLRLSWVAPTEQLIELGGELLAGSNFPAGDEQSDNQSDNDNIGAYVLFATVGNDIGTSHSWQAGVSYYYTDAHDRSSNAHSHGHGDHVHTESVLLTGDIDILGLNLVYKWAPHGNYKDRHLKVQTEFFWQRDRNAEIAVITDDHAPQTSTFKGDQQGFYIQGIYQFAPQWGAGIRYDYLNSDNRGSNRELLKEADLISSHNPQRWSAMVQWLPSEFSRIRLQYNRDHSYARADNQFFVQYTMSLGSHGAHTF